MLYNGGNYAKLKCVQPQPSPFQGENGGKNIRRGISVQLGLIGWLNRGSTLALAGKNL